MVFSSKIFLFYFLPITLLIYFLVRRNRRLGNLFLTVMSLGFYAWGEPRFVLVMMASIVANWIFGLLVDRFRGTGKAKAAVAVMVVFDLGLLGVFKYLMFIMNSVNAVFRTRLPVPQIALPIGISFFTFQAMSYVIDVYRGKGEVQRNLVNVSLYIAFFPQLIAGPIVRYQTIADEIMDRRENWKDFSEGCQRFLVGLCKKLILANQLGLLVDTARGLQAADLSAATAWLGALAYLIQVYYDFSGYSDMAIGLGRMFGFHFQENFNYPFISKSVSEFWRRWHISMTTWFRDYLYIPLGGSRVKSKARLIFNIFMIWFCTGLWHGAAWVYVLWGLSFFAIGIVERFTPLGKWIESRGILGVLYMMFMVVTVTVLIRSSSMAEAGAYYAAMFGVSGTGFTNAVTGALLREYGWFLLAAIVCSLPIGQWLREKLHVPDAPIRIVSALGLAACTVIAFSYVSVVDYNPFIYFNF